MRNISDSRAPSTDRLELPEENSATIKNSLSQLSSTFAMRENQGRKEQENFVQKTYRTKSTDDDGLLDDMKSGIDPVSEYLHNTLLDVDLYEGISVFTTNVYRSVVDLINVENLSPEEVKEKVDQQYGNIRTELSARHKKGSPEQVHQFNHNLDEKIRADKQYINTLEQSTYRQKALGTIDDQAEKYGHGVTQSPETLTDAMISIEDTVNKLAPGIGRDAAIAKINETRGTLYSKALKGYAGQKNYTAVQSLLNGVDPVTEARLSSSNYINNKDRDYFQDLADKGVRREAGLQLLNEVEAQVHSENELLDSLKNHPNSDIGQEALSLYQNKKRIEVKANRDRKKNQRYAVWRNVAENKGNIDSAELPLDLSDEDRDIFNSYLDNINFQNIGLYDREGLSDQKAKILLYELNKLHIEKPDLFADRDFSDYFKDLSPKQISRIMAMQKHEPDPNDAARFKMREREALRAWKKVTGRNGYDAPDRQKFINFSIRFGELVDEFNEIEEKPASSVDIEQIANRMIENDEVIPLERGDEFLSSVEDHHLENESDSSVDFSTSTGRVSNEEEFNNLIAKQVELPEGVAATFVEDEQTALDDKHTGKPSYNVIFHDENGNRIDGPATMKRLPGEPNEQSYLRYMPGEGFLRYQSRNKEQYNLASTAVRNYLFELYGRHPETEAEEKEASLLAENIYGIIREDYGDEKHISQGNIYSMIDDLADQGKAPRLNGYKPPTTQLERDLENYYNETNIFSRSTEGFMYGLRGVLAGHNISVALNHLKLKEEFGDRLKLSEEQLIKAIEVFKKRAENNNMPFNESDYELELEGIKEKIAENKKYFEEYEGYFTNFLKSGAEYRELMKLGRRNPVLMAMENINSLEEFWELMSHDPIGVMRQYVLENMASAAASAAGGALGGVAGGAAVSASIDHSNILLNKLEELGADFDKPETVQEIMRKHGDKIIKDANLGAAVAGVASIVAGKFGSNLTNDKATQKLLEAGSEAGIKKVINDGLNAKVKNGGGGG